MRWMGSAAWTWMRYLAGQFLNATGIPGVVADGDYHAEIYPAEIRVKVGPLFTVVAVNGLDIYFHRLTGVIDGVGFSPAADCKRDGVPRSTGSAAPPAAENLPASASPMRPLRSLMRPFVGKARSFAPADTRIIPIRVLEQPRHDVAGLADVKPEYGLDAPILVITMGRRAHTSLRNTFGAEPGVIGRSARGAPGGSTRGHATAILMMGGHAIPSSRARRAPIHLPRPTASRVTSAAAVTAAHA